MTASMRALASPPDDAAVGLRNSCCWAASASHAASCCRASTDNRCAAAVLLSIAVWCRAAAVAVNAQRSATCDRWGGGPYVAISLLPGFANGAEIAYVSNRQ